MRVYTNVTGRELSGYSMVADVPSLNPSEMSGSTGSISVTTAPLQDYQFLRNKPFTLTDERFGSLTGRVGTIANSENQLVLSGESSLRRLTAEVSIPPKYLASTAACMDEALSLAGFTSAGLPTGNVDSFPGWRGTLLDYVKHFCAVYRVEYYLTKSSPNVLNFRTVGGAEVAAGSFYGFSNTLDDQSLSQNVEVIVREFTVPGNTSDSVEFTPAYAESDPQILTVDAGAVTEYEIKLNGWVREVNQPVAVDYVSPGEQTGVGSYCVAGNDGLPISAAQWTAFGGSVRVEITEDPSVLRVTVTAPQQSPLRGSDGVTDRYAPYSIGATAVLDNTFYNSLHITGKGIRTRNNTLACPTGATSDTTVEGVGATVDNPFVSSLSRGWGVAVECARAYSGPTHTFSASLIPSGSDIEDTLGSVTRREVFKFRVESITVGPDGATTSGNAYVTISDFDSLWGGKTIGEFDTVWDDKTFGEHAAAPLWGG